MTVTAEKGTGSGAYLRVGVVCADQAYASELSKALSKGFGAAAGAPVLSPREDADALVYAFPESDVAQPDFVERESEAIRGDAAPTKIFLELVSSETLGARAREIADHNKRIAQLAHDHGGYLVPLMSKFMRWDPERLLTGNGALNRRGHQAVARTVAKFLDRFDVRRSLDAGAADSREEAAASADTILSAIRWSGPDLPRTIRFGPDESNVSDFLDGYASFPSYPNWGRVQISQPIDWSMPGPNRSWQSYFLGLEFLGPVLGLYFALANDMRLRDARVFKELLREKAADPIFLLTRAADVIADFLKANPPEAPMAQRAWHEGTVCRRIKILLTYLICCRSAQERGDRVDESTVIAAFVSLKSSIDMLLSDRVYIKSGNHGVRQDALIIVTALVFADTDVFGGLCHRALDRLRRCQLDTMLTADGVWQENSFEYHRLIMGLLGDLVFDMHTAGADGVSLLLDALGRMETFAEAVVKCDGQAPLIGDTTPREALRAIMAARSLISSLRGGREAGSVETFERSQETYCFPASGYFASHSARSLGLDVSSLIFYANLSAPKHKHADDLSVLFSHGAVDLLIDGGTYNKETSDDIRNAARFDPATHNTYRVNGKGYSIRARQGKPLAGITAQWGGENWSAARGFNNAYEDGRVERTVIHLKRHSALVVVDTLKSNSFFSPCDFEQFWHIAPQFRPAPSPAGIGGLVFASDSDGYLLAAFDDDTATCKVEQGGPGNPIAWLMVGDEEIVPTPYIRRARRARKAMMASLFQWSRAPAVIEIVVSGTRIDIKAAGVAAMFDVGAGEVKCLRLSG